MTAEAQRYRQWVKAPEPDETYDPAEHYPLLADMYGYRTPHDHVYIYINAAFAAAEEGAS